jgi:hypothetical protein
MPSHIDMTHFFELLASEDDRMTRIFVRGVLAVWAVASVAIWAAS